MTAYARGWGDPSRPSFKSNLITINVGGIKLRVHREVAPLFEAFISRIVARGYDLDDRPDDWGQIFRPIRDYEDEWKETHDFKYLSNHSWGLAIDLNAQTNPMTSDNRVHTDMPDWVIEEATKCSLYWGGHYKGKRKDPMHFEYVGTPDQVKAAIKQLSQSGDDEELNQEEKEMLKDLHDWIGRLHHEFVQGDESPETLSKLLDRVDRNTRKK